MAAADSEPRVIARLRGTVVKGFGRGSKELGIPTANLDEDTVATLPPEVVKGIYVCWSQIDGGEVLPAVMSVGKNPYYNNEKLSAEVHILKEFAQDFYGSKLNVLVLKFLRPEKNFDSLEALIAAIHADIQQTRDVLESKPLMSDELFTSA
eukprot:m.484595 g.484595  ORF g.484595 m.484595 type:complete len:151 (+) comp23443_c0_seq1:195-647(+)